MQKYLIYILIGLAFIMALMYIIYITKNKRTNSSAVSTSNSNASSTTKSTASAPSVSQSYTPSTTDTQPGFWSTYGDTVVSSVAAPFAAPFLWGSKLFD